ncbi:RDD family protein [Salicibibacter cibarius]|nr:RDD family protein [Salicibibacter cibarius]
MLFLGMFIPLITGSTIHETTKIVLFILIIAVAITLYLGKDSVKGKSLGKWLFGIEVRMGRNLKEFPEKKQVFIRNLILAILTIIEFAVLIFNKKTKRIGDMAGDTVVIAVKPGTASVLKGLLSLGLLIIMFNVLPMFIANQSAVNQFATNYIEQDETINEMTGGVEGFGSFPSISYSGGGNGGQYESFIDVEGENQDINVNIVLHREGAQPWDVVSIAYQENHEQDWTMIADAHEE